MAEDVVLKTDGLTKRFGKLTAVDNVSITIKKGQIYGFLGPNGAGKSTTIRMLTGFLKPTAGELRIFGEDIYKNSNVKKRIGIVPDAYDFYSVLNAYDHLEFYGRLSGMNKKNVMRRIPEILSVVGFEKEWRTQKVSTYSHGMKQRLCIAQALIHEPEIIFLDEPTSGLDPKGAYETRQLVKQLNKNGLTVFVSSHVLSEVEDMCTHVGIINHGVLITEGSIDSLQKQIVGAEGIKVIVKAKKVTPELTAALRAQPFITDVVAKEENTLEIIAHGEDVVPKINRLIVEQGVDIYSISEATPTLEKVFLEATDGTKAQPKNSQANEMIGGET